MTSSRLTVLLLSLAFAGCSLGRPPAEANSPQEARGETRVRYVICAEEDRNCFVAARFIDAKSCEMHRKFWSMECQGVDREDGFTCRPSTETATSGAYCVL